MAWGEVLLLAGFALLCLGLAKRRRPPGRGLILAGIVVIGGALLFGEFRVPLPGVMEGALEGWQRK